jgi:hypothetical protein
MQAQANEIISNLADMAGIKVTAVDVCGGIITAHVESDNDAVMFADVLCKSGLKAFDMHTRGNHRVCIS